MRAAEKEIRTAILRRLAGTITGEAKAGVRFRVECRRHRIARALQRQIEMLWDTVREWNQ